MAEPEYFAFTIASDTGLGTTLKYPAWAEYMGLYVEPRSAGTDILLYISPPTGTDAGCALANTGTDYVVVDNSYSDAGYWDISSLIPAFIGDFYFKTAATLPEAISGYVYFRGRLA